MICLVPDAKIEEHCVLPFSEILIGFLVPQGEVCYLSASI